MNPLPKLNVFVKNWIFTNCSMLISVMKFFYHCYIIQNIQNYSTIYSPIFNFFYFGLKLCCNMTNPGVLISNMTIVFKIIAQRYPNNAFFVTSWKIFCYCKNVILKNLKVLSSNTAIVFSKFSLKIAK